MWRQHRVGCRHACTADIQHRYRLELDIKNIRIARRPVRDQGCHHVDLGPVKEWGYPATEEYRDRWPQYPAALQLCEFAPDLVLIDGRFRVACALYSMMKCTAKTRYVIHDFWNREYYHGVLEFLECVERADSLGVFVAKDAVDWQKLALVLIAHAHDFQ